MEIILKYLSAYLIAVFKYAWFVPIQIKYFQMSFPQAVLFGLLSGISGVVLLMFIADYTNQLLNKLKVVILPDRYIYRKKKKFNRRNRTIVKVKARYGLVGISLLTPIAFGLPLGVFLAVRYYGNKLRTGVVLSLGVVLWSFIYALIALT